MTSFVKFTPITGSHDEGPLCYLLQIDNINILLDCGAASDFSSTCMTTTLLNKTMQIDAIILSHADMSHIGSLPLLYKQLALTCPVFATLPVQTLGQICLQDALSSIKNMREFSLFSMEDIDSVFDKITSLRYSQPYQMIGKCLGITLTSYAAGHTVGGSIWKIKKDTNDIVYAVDYNQKKELHLNGSVLHLGLPQLSRPSLLITDSFNALNSQQSRKERDASMIENIISTLQSKGNVLLPVESATRVLELASVLDQHWSENNITFPLTFLAPHSQKTINVAKTCLEWFSDTIAQAFSQKRELPFELNQFRVCSKIEEVLSRQHVPQVVLVSTSGLTTGFSNELMHQWASDPNSLILLPERGEPGSISHYLHEYWSFQASTNQFIQMKHDYNTTHEIKTLLSGPELETQIKIKQESERLQLRKQESQRRQSRAQESDSESEDLEVDRLHHTTHDTFIKNQNQNHTFFKATLQHKMFPVKEYRRKYDDYGECIDANDFVQGEYHAALAQAAIDTIPERPIEIVEEIEAPFKYTSEIVVLEFRCKLVYIDFEGRADGKSIKNIIPQLAPRKIILVHGSEKSTDNLAAYLRMNDGVTSDVFTPRIGEIIDVSTKQNMFELTLSDSLFKSIDFFKKGDYEIAYVSGKLLYDPEYDSSHIGSKRKAFILDKVESKDKTSKPIIIGDVKLSEFKKVLGVNGYSPEFVHGNLMFAQLGIIIRKDQSGKLILEGKVSDDYFTIRNLIYAQHVLLN